MTWLTFRVLALLTLVDLLFWCRDCRHRSREVEQIGSAHHQIGLAAARRCRNAIDGARADRPWTVRWGQRGLPESQNYGTEKAQARTFGRQKAQLGSCSLFLDTRLAADVTVRPLRDRKPRHGPLGVCDTGQLARAPGLRVDQRAETLGLFSSGKEVDDWRLPRPPSRSVTEVGGSVIALAFTKQVPRQAT